MAIIHILGGSGFTGAHLAAEAVKRGHDVTSVSRREPSDPIEGVRYVQASLTDPAARENAVLGADVVIATLSPRGEMAGRVPEIYADLARSAVDDSARFVVIGGFGSMRPAADTPRFYEGDAIPVEYRGESAELGRVLDALEASRSDLDWLYVSPAAAYNAHSPGEATGEYRVGGAVVDSADGAPTTISAADFATAVIDEIETPRHRREHVSYYA